MTYIKVRNPAVLHERRMHDVVRQKRFYFHRWSNGVLTDEVFSRDCADCGDACAQARRSIADLLRDGPHDRDRHEAVEIFDSNERPVAIVRGSLILETW